MYLYVYIYINICMYMYMYIYTYIYIYKSPCTCTLPRQGTPPPHERTHHLSPWRFLRDPPMKESFHQRGTNSSSSCIPTIKPPSQGRG